VGSPPSTRTAPVARVTRPEPAKSPGPQPPAPVPVPELPVERLRLFVDQAVVNEFFFDAVAGTVVGGEVHPEAFWEQYRTTCRQEDQQAARRDRAYQENVTLARIAALMQVLAPEPPGMRLGLVQYLATVSHPEATRALAKLTLFSAESEVREAAIDALKVRRERDYTDILMQGFHYPWPAVARRAGAAVVKLDRSDLLQQLVALLDEPDPRAPVVKQVKDRKVPVVRELVRLNHHRSCLVCHAPGNTPTVSADTLTAPVPVPGQPMPSPSTGYGSSIPDVLVRVDVTYLRQDFSVLQPVADAGPWPDMQRFDFLVRSRDLTEDEARSYRERLEPKQTGALSPYHRAVLTALRELTGRDTAPTPGAWRRLLKLPGSHKRTEGTE